MLQSAYELDREFDSIFLVLVFRDFSLDFGCRKTNSHEDKVLLEFAQF